MKSTARNLLLSLLLLPFGLLNAQITFEADYAHSGTFTQLANSGHKFYIMDVGNRQCRIYNTDHSLWKTIDLDVPAGHYLYDIRYVSENLFTDDNTLSLCYIYYFYDEVYQYYTYTLKIINEDGTNLRTVEGAQYVVVNDIGEAGTKLSVYVYDYSNIIYTITTLVYDLPGQLISSGAGTGHENEALGRSAFPNPAGDYTIIPFALPETSSSGEILLTDAKGNLIRQFKVDHHFRDLRINTGQLPAGIYFYHLTAGNYKSEAKKIIVR